MHSLKTYAHVYVNVGQTVMDMYITMQSCAGTYVQSQHCPSYRNLIVTLFLYLHLNHFVYAGVHYEYGDTLRGLYVQFCDDSSLHIYHSNIQSPSTITVGVL